MVKERTGCVINAFFPLCGASSRVLLSMVIMDMPAVIVAIVEDWFESMAA